MRPTVFSQQKQSFSCIRLLHLPLASWSLARKLASRKWFRFFNYTELAYGTDFSPTYLLNFTSRMSQKLLSAGV
jgi:hypothetical protein